MEQLIIQLISGAVGGNVAGAAMKEKSLGTIGNSLAGIVGDSRSRNRAPKSHNTFKDSAILVVAFVACPTPLTGGQ